MKKRILAGILVLVMALALLTGCGKKPTAPADGTAPAPVQETTRAASNEITVGIAQDLDESLDPHLTVAAGTREVMFNVFEGLVKPTSDGDLVPAVASDVSVADDGLTYTFTLRQGVKFHNGDPVDMQDVLFSINRNADTSSGEALIPALTAIADMQVEGDTLTITLSEPNPEFLSYLTLAILPEGYDKQDTAPIGTGPFKFVSRTAQDNIVLERFADYWGTPAKLDKVTYKVIENVEGLILGLQSGALDLVSHLSSTQTAQLSSKDFVIEEGTMNLVQAMYLNNAVKPFDDVRVRQALCYAVDKQAILDLAFDGYGHPLGSSMYPAFTKYYDESLTDYYTQDIEKAKALLAEAGYPNGFDMTITVPSNYQPHMDTAQVLVEQLKAIGVNATILPIEWASWLSDVYSGRDYQSTVVGVDASSMTARAMLSRFESTAHNNFVNYNNAEYDALYAQALSCYDDAEQTGIYRQMERNLTENAANVYIQDMADLVAVRQGLEGLTFYPLYVLDVSTLHWVNG
ncbi:MAG: ABC transporter substrate-binding protein [Oscillospiraceae bacterium]|nr:ABC transporter substrate-binding protein [Oscillospiraceae bacterium]